MCSRQFLFLPFTHTHSHGTCGWTIFWVSLLPVRPVFVVPMFRVLFVDFFFVCGNGREGLFCSSEVVPRILFSAPLGAHIFHKFQLRCRWIALARHRALLGRFRWNINQKRIIQSKFHSTPVHAVWCSQCWPGCCIGDVVYRHTHIRSIYRADEYTILSAK